MRKKLAGAILAAGIVAAAGCNSAPSPSASSPAASASSSYFSELNRELQLRPVLVGCLAQRGLIPAKDLDSRWYSNGHVTTNKYWTMWWSSFNGLPVKIDGTWMHLSDVARQAATDGTWPTALCGPLPSASPS
jgi:hypothetical protein